MLNLLHICVFDIVNKLIFKCSVEKCWAFYEPFILFPSVLLRKRTHRTPCTVSDTYNTVVQGIVPHCVITRKYFSFLLVGWLDDEKSIKIIFA